MGLAIVVDQAFDPRSRDRTDETRHRYRGVNCLDSEQGLNLVIDERQILQRATYLEDIVLTVLGGQAKILVAFAGKGLEPARDVPGTFDELDQLRFRQCRWHKAQVLRCQRTLHHLAQFLFQCLDDSLLCVNSCCIEKWDTSSSAPAASI